MASMPTEKAHKFIDVVTCRTCGVKLGSTCRLFLSSCKHIFCKTCIESANKQCAECNVSARWCEICDTMPPNLRVYFEDFKDIRTTNPDILMFQLNQMNLYNVQRADIWEKYEMKKKEISKKLSQIEVLKKRTREELALAARIEVAIEEKRTGVRANWSSDSLNKSLGSLNMDESNG